MLDQVIKRGKLQFNHPMKKSFSKTGEKRFVTNYRKAWQKISREFYSEVLPNFSFIFLYSS